MLRALSSRHQSPSQATLQRVRDQSSTWNLDVLEGVLSGVIGGAVGKCSALEGGKLRLGRLQAMACNWQPWRNQLASAHK